MVEFELEFQYAQAQKPALQRACGSIPAGRCVVLCGGSGCGKSTLLRCLNGLIPQFYEGELTGFCRLNGQDTAGLSIGKTGELAASVFQDPRSQFFTVNSSNEVAFGLENHGLPQADIKKRVDEAFRVFHLERLKDRNVYELSSGERQLISILSAWAMDTDIFLLDEQSPLAFLLRVGRSVLRIAGGSRRCRIHSVTAARVYLWRSTIFKIKKETFP